ncbi:hypothetical protein Ahy_B08g090137 isoform C [Arachis hypogaea]|uniref:Uncharacterized protein n=1 Tax=Arachis hypogaea TaxID=3818 RepID=A0A444XZL6_ARAHY|nr:hypothetical protein Ahy_B08g090137 isoform C [Arachis hypogaea]
MLCALSSYKAGSKGNTHSLQPFAFTVHTLSYNHLSLSHSLSRQFVDQNSIRLLRQLHRSKLLEAITSDVVQYMTSVRIADFDTVHLLGEWKPDDAF